MPKATFSIRNETGLWFYVACRESGALSRSHSLWTWVCLLHCPLSRLFSLPLSSTHAAASFVDACVFSLLSRDMPVSELSALCAVLVPSLVARGSCESLQRCLAGWLPCCQSISGLLCAGIECWQVDGVVGMRRAGGRAVESQREGSGWAPTKKKTQASWAPAAVLAFIYGATPSSDCWSAGSRDPTGAFWPLRCLACL